MALQRGTDLADCRDEPTLPEVVDITMWDWINCHLCARHEYCVWSEPGSVFLRCIHCGRRSNGWQLGAVGQRISHVHDAPSAPQLAGTGSRFLRWAFGRSATAH
jgi:hypothetical protein